MRAAQEQAARIERAQQRLVEREQEKVERAKRNAKAEKKKRAPQVSVSDPEVRSMRMADGATHPAWNVQVATAQGFEWGLNQRTGAMIPAWRKAW